MIARLFAAALLLAGLTQTALAGPTLDQVRAAGALACGTVDELNDETLDDTHGNLSALGADFCQALGAAILGPGHVALQTFPTEALAYDALAHGRIAVLFGATPDPGIAKHDDLTYLTPLYFDAQGVMVHKDRGIASLHDLAGKSVCFIANTDAEIQLHRAADRLGLKGIYFPFTEVGEMEAALVDGHCDAQTGDLSRLAFDRSLFHGMRNDFVMLPDRLSLDPWAPVVRSGDAEWARIVDWVGYALIEAAANDVTKANAADQRHSADPTVQSLVGVRRGVNWGLGLADDWSFKALSATGNYDEIIDRDVGPHSVLRLDPGPNRPWTEGGMLWSPPFR